MNDASRYAWACSVFGLQPGASPQEVRAAVMSHLDDADFVPPAGWRQAIRLLCEPQSSQAGPPSGYDAFRQAQENDLAEEVDQFAAQFFTLPSGPRHARWTQLLEQAAAFPRLSARLRLLQPGLDAESAMPDGPEERDSILSNRIRRLFLLKPGAQDLQRRQWLAAMTGDWRPVVRRVRGKHPKLARLDADFLSALESSQHGAAAVKPRPAFSSNTNLAAAFIAVPKTAAAKPSPARRKTKSGSGPMWAFNRWVVIVVLLGIVRFVSTITQTPNNSYSPAYSLPPPTPREIDEIIKKRHDHSDDLPVRRLFGREINEMSKKLHDPTESVGSLPSDAPSPWPSGSLDPRVPSSTDNSDADEKFRKLLLTPLPPLKNDPPSSPPFWSDTSPSANSHESARKGSALPAGAPPASPAIPGAPPR